MTSRCCPSDNSRKREGPPGLVAAQHIALTALGEIEVGEFEPVQRGRHRREPLARLGLPGQRRHQQAEAGMLTAADATAELMQLADAEPVGVHHQHHGGVGHVDTDLDDGGAHQDIDVARPEAGHHGVLLLRTQPAVHETQAQTRQLMGPQPVEQLHHRGGLARRSAVSGGARHGLVVIVDTRGDHIDLPPGRHFLPDALPRPLQPDRLLGGEHHTGGDGLTAPRQLPQRRRLQVAVDGERNRARDRRRGHHQQMRRDAAFCLGAQLIPLLDAEPVLLVDHHHAELMELDRFLNQRMGADDDARLGRRRSRREPPASAPATSNR